MSDSCVSAAKAPRTPTEVPPLERGSGKLGVAVHTASLPRLFGTCCKLLEQDLLHNGFAGPKPSLMACPEDHSSVCSFLVFYFPVQQGLQDWNQLLFLE